MQDPKNESKIKICPWNLHFSLTSYNYSLVVGSNEEGTEYFLLSRLCFRPDQRGWEIFFPNQALRWDKFSPLMHQVA